ncbi:MAG: hypothetical protein QNL14_09020, partial [Deltaproteobacteria bacterium]|nr:hypothetical protein [Deltaproteobacteria bacterium]
GTEGPVVDIIKRSAVPAAAEPVVPAAAEPTVPAAAAAEPEVTTEDTKATSEAEKTGVKDDNN